MTFSLPLMLALAQGASATELFLPDELPGALKAAEARGGHAATVVVSANARAMTRDVPGMADAEVVSTISLGARVAQRLAEGRPCVVQVGPRAGSAIAVEAHGTCEGSLRPRAVPSFDIDALEPVALAPLEFRDRGHLKPARVAPYRLRLLERMREAGYPVGGAGSGQPALNTGTKATMQIGGTVLGSRCVSPSSSQHVCELRVLWELSDLRSKETVYRTTTNGLSYEVGQAPTEEGSIRALEEAFGELLAQDALVGQLKRRDADASGERPPTWTGPVDILNCPDDDRALPADLDDALDATLVVRAGDGLGSGVLVSPDGFAFTAAHVVEGHKRVEVRTRAGDVWYAAVVRTDRSQDVALLAVEGSEHPCLALVTGEPRVGTEVYAIGSPLAEDLDFSVSKGIVSGIRQMREYRFLQTDASLNPGNSGGPLIGLDGRVVGVVSWKLAGGGVEGLGFGVPVGTLSTRLDLSFGDLSASDLPMLTGHRGGVAAPKAVVEGPVANSRLLRYFEPGPRAARRGGRDAADLTLVTGVTMILATWAWHQAGSSVSQGEWDAMRALNTVGWVAALGGGGSAIVVRVVR